MVLLGGLGAVQPGGLGVCLFFECSSFIRSKSLRTGSGCSTCPSQSLGHQQWGSASGGDLALLPDGKISSIGLSFKYSQVLGSS
ncbi:hypothetical protein Y1Q_0001222 [Alligator mississippiensis]|uniref:Uncharacterized protein n=1 Tax=Alligator mississippiensis TaxID=8496 RepID=A0A151PF75_ALLMI|nr:hypothetical protein Y1Q_0001222 [Alligator mississippiensis]